MYKMENVISSDKYIKVVKNGHIGEVILNRPNEYNRMDDNFFTTFKESIELCDNDKDIRVILIWGEGKMFTSGLDIKSVASIFFSSNDNRSNAEKNLDLYKLIKRWQSSFTSLQKTNKPVITAIHGHCIGGGVDLITASDIRLCTEDATFSVAETKIAIVADLGTLQRLSSIVGKGIAREMIFTGEKINSTVAEHVNLVNKVYKDKEELLNNARKMANEIADNSPFVVQAVKKLLNMSERQTIEDSLETLALWNSSFLHSTDLMEAIKSFMIKKKPKFRNLL